MAFSHHVRNTVILHGNEESFPLLLVLCSMPCANCAVKQMFESDISAVALALLYNSRRDLPATGDRGTQRRYPPPTEEYIKT
jgi:hypothetical protein